MSLKQFKVVSGKHTDHGTTYTKGDVIVSHLPLDKVFVNKFEVISQPVPVYAQSPTSEKTAAVSPPIGSGVDEIGASSTPSSSVEVETKVDETEETTEHTFDGKDRTVAFPQAVKVGIIVMRAEGAYHLYDGESGEQLNDTPLSSKAKVVKILAKYEEE